jgi:hypothetical protein
MASTQRNPLDSRIIGVKVIYEMIRKTVRDTVEEFISEMNVNPIDAADIRYKLLTKDILEIHIPSTRDEEMEAMDWLYSIRTRLTK